MLPALVVGGALLLESMLGEPRRCHPLVGFGKLAVLVERRLHAASVFRGTVAVAVLVLPLAGLAAWLHMVLPTAVAVVFDLVVVYLAIGWKSLEQHAEAVRTALVDGDLPRARQLAGRMVSRDMEEAGSEEIAGAAVESVLENGNDAVFGVIFWFVLTGAPGVICYRLVNTLDAMWGYRSTRYDRFGRCAARLDDILNYLPARLTALAYAVCGMCRAAVRCWRAQAGAWQSPNAGPVMAAGAGSLGVYLGGTVTYRGELRARPVLGEGRRPRVADIGRATALVRRSVLLWLSLLIVGGGIASLI